MAKARKRKRLTPRKSGRQGGRPATKTDPKKVLRATECAEALRFRKLGYSLEDIGSFMTPPCGTTKVHTLITEALRTTLIEDVEDVRKMELQRLDDLTIKAMENAMAGDTRSIDAVLKIMQRRADILGYDAPKKQEVTGKDGQPIVHRIERVVVDSPHRDPALDAPVPPAGPV